MAADVETVAPKPRSPPKYPDFCGRRRLQLEVQILNREVGFIEEELQSLDGLQPVSRCCKEVNEFVGTNPDPLIPLNKRRHRSCKFWRWLGSKLCCGFSWICCCAGCCAGCCHQCKWPSCTCCPHPNNCCSCQCNCLRCCIPQSSCFQCPCSNCCPKISCSCPKSCCCCCKWTSCCCPWTLSCCQLPKCCSCCEASWCKMPKCCCTCCPPTISCPEYSCGCVLDCPKCTEVRLCPKCSKPCCVTGCLC